MHKHHRRLSLAADIALALAIILVFFIGITVGFRVAPDPIREIVYKTVEEKATTIFIPAVKDDGSGVLTTLTAKLKEGNGQVLVNVGDVISGYELQLSARQAVHIIENLTKVNFDDYDVTFSIQTDATMVDGRSASAAMAVAILSLIENRTLNPKVTITGAIEDEGLISPVGMIESKAAISKSNEMGLMLVPRGQGKKVEQIENIACDSDELEYCKVDYMPHISEADFSGMQVKEVADVYEALQWFEIGGLEKFLAEAKAIGTVPESKTKERFIDITQLGIKDFSIGEYTLTDVEIAGPMIIFKTACTRITLTTSESHAESVIKGIQDSIIGRPNAHDLIKTTFDIYDIEVIAVLISRYEAGTYYAKLITMSGNKVLSLDSTPSDALGIASRFYAPVYVKHSILANQGEEFC